MDRRIDDEDDDVFASLNATNNTDSRPPNIYLHSYSEKFAPSPPNQSSDDDDDDVSQKISLDDGYNYNYQKAPPKVYDRFYDTSSSDEDSEFTSQNDAVQKRLDYMIQYLDRKLSDNFVNGNGNGNGNGSSNSQSPKAEALAEFVGRGGGTGMFKLPVRAAVHPGRPPSLELRPHPLRETQVGCFLRSIDCVNDGDGDRAQLWAGSECGLKVWDLKDMYSAAAEKYKEEEDAAPFYESVKTSATLCVVGDAGNKVVWTGHKDGKIRCWKMQNVSGNGFKEGLSWQAHRGPVLSMVFTSYGDLWTGSEGGAIKIWPWEAIEKSLSLPMEERHMSALLIERSYVDLRSQVMLNGASCGIFASDIKYMLSDRSGARVWSASYLSFALWDARTRDLLKMFNVDGQIENMSAIQDPVIEDEVRVRVASISKKEKTQSSIGFFQRSRNAIMGAADAVRRAATKGTFGDDNRRTEALVVTVDGMIWTGCANGLLVLWDGNGNRLQDFQHHNSSVQSLCTYGSRTWVGYASGVVQVLDLNGNLLGEWVAHNSPVIDLAIGSDYIFTLANHGGIRGWNITSPGPLDGIMRSELAEKDFLYTRLETMKILAGTWNVGQGRATHDSLISWLGSAAADVGIVVVGLQEVEMGAGFLAMSAAKETMQLGLDGSSVGQWWLDMIGQTLDEGSTFVRLGSRQLAGLLIAVWVRNDIRSHVGDVDVAAVPCGFGRAIGNKGAVGLRMRVYGRTMCFINCHFAAHLEAVGRRNADFDHVYRTMVFSRPSNLFNAAAASASSGVQILRSANCMGVNSAGGKPELSEADMVVFLGDFNYRLHGISYDEARDFISQRSFDWLRERDQLRAEMEAGNVFQGMREAVIRFPPTYKFERHQAGLAGYDSGEKKRIPAWCDRILHRDSRSVPVSTCSLECPVVSSVLQYEACMDVTDSDHKPVRCIFRVEIARVDESVRRQEFGEILRSNEKIRFMLAKRCKMPDAIVSTNNIILQNQDASILRITNKDGKDKACFEIFCEGQSTIRDDGQALDHRPRGCFGFPMWLEVSPASGIIKPDQIVEISVRHEGYQTLEEYVDGIPQNSWCEDARDQEVILIAKVLGCFTTETKSHRIRVRYSFCGKTSPMERKIDSSNHLQQSNLLRRSDFQRLSCSPDVVDQLRNLHSP